MIGNGGQRDLLVRQKRAGVVKANRGNVFVYALTGDVPKIPNQFRFAYEKPLGKAVYAQILRHMLSDVIDDLLDVHFRVGRDRHVLRYQLPDFVQQCRQNPVTQAPTFSAYAESSDPDTRADLP